ncbi:YIP1 family protein [Phaeovulum sp.]|uniref:YIP1 family protein n=1 Tax=Phaeovulum sp. TaxID=2934796 RepID=UPI0039E361A4
MRQMGVVPKIVTTWARPRVVMRAILAQGPREDRALATLLGACVVLFVAQWPMHARAAYLDPTIPLEARLSGALMGAVFLLPVLAYTIAGLSHVVIRVFGGRGSHSSARIALFWALLAVSPWMLLHGLVAGFVGSGAALSLVGAAVGLGFLLIWGAGLRVAEFEG